MQVGFFYAVGSADTTSKAYPHLQFNRVQFKTPDSGGLLFIFLTLRIQECENMFRLPILHALKRIPPLQFYRVGVAMKVAHKSNPNHKGNGLGPSGAKPSK